MKKFLVFGFLLFFLIGCNIKNPDGTLNNWYSNEIKFCNSQGKILNDTYYINSVKIVECKNESMLVTYKFSNINDNDGLGEGIIIGWLLFSK